MPRKPVYISLPFKGDDVSERIRSRITTALERTCNAARLVYLEETTRIPVPSRKDPLSPLANSNIIYQFSCTCGCTYVGRTERHLGTRIDEHIPKWLRSNKSGVAKSAITKHLQETGYIVDVVSAFSVIGRARNSRELAFKEAVSIRRLKPPLCVQKQMVINLALPW